MGSWRVFLKILENFFNFSKISNPQENCCALFYTYVVVTPNPPLIYLKLKKNKGPKMDSLHFTFFHFIHNQKGRRSIAGTNQQLQPTSVLTAYLSPCQHQLVQETHFHNVVVHTFPCC